MLALKHLQKRKKRLALKASTKTANHPYFDNIVYLISFLGPILTLPQVYDIWVRKSVSINVITWGSYVFFAMIWLAYGLIHKEKPIILSNILWILVDSLVVFGVMMYR